MHCSRIRDAVNGKWFHYYFWGVERGQMTPEKQSSSVNILLKERSRRGVFTLDDIIPPDFWIGSGLEKY